MLHLFKKKKKPKQNKPFSSPFCLADEVSRNLNRENIFCYLDLAILGLYTCIFLEYQHGTYSE